MVDRHRGLLTTGAGPTAAPRADGRWKRSTADESADAALSRKTVLVTGGAGFIGSHLVDRLIIEGARVRVLDNLSTGDLNNLPLDQIEFLEGDVRSEADVARAVAGAQVVFHQAAQINPAKAVVDPIFDFEVNARGTLNLMLACVRAGVERLIMACTNVYGDAVAPCMAEDLSTLAVDRTLLSPYAASKVAAEAYLKVANDELGLPTVRLRYFNAYGPRQLTKSESGVVAIFVLNALAGKPLRIFGDGTQTRDFVYVSDVVEANMLAMSSPAAPGRCYNVGTGVETSVKELAHCVRELVENDLPIEYGPARAADFKRAKADLTRSARELGFHPTVSLRAGLRHYIAWCRTKFARPL